MHPQADVEPVVGKRHSAQADGMAWTYLLECADGSYYVGSTVDLDRRLAEHQNGEGASYTRRAGRRPVRLVWSAQFDRIEDAFLYERRIHGWRRAKREALIAGEFELLPELSSRRRSVAEVPEPLGEGLEAR